MIAELSVVPNSEKVVNRCDHLLLEESMANILRPRRRIRLIDGATSLTG